MVRKIVWSLEALELLEGILTYWNIRNQSKSYSLKLNKLFQDCIKQVCKFPKSGRSTQLQNVRYRIVRNYFIYYKYTEKEIIILSLCDMRRDPEYIRSLIKN